MFLALEGADPLEGSRNILHNGTFVGRSKISQGDCFEGWPALQVGVGALGSENSPFYPVVPIFTLPPPLSLDS